MPGVIVRVIGSISLGLIPRPLAAFTISGSASRRENSVMPRPLAAGIGILALRNFYYRS
jgi:hypothetical protein